MIDWKYIIKRVIVGLVLFVSIFFLKKYLFLNVLAETLQPTTACVIGGQQNSVCGTPPVYDGFNTSYGTAGVNVWFQQTNMLQTGGTYYITFSAYLQGNNSVMSHSDIQLFTGNNGTASSSATPDRNEQFNFYQVSANTYRVIWSFELDSYSNFNTIRFSFPYANVVGYNGMPLGVVNATMDITTNTPGSSDNSDVIINNNDNTQDIINNQNQNTQDIIDNQNSNTQEIVDAINDNFKSCTTTKTKNKLDYSNYLQSSNSGLNFSYNSSTGYLSVSGTSSDITSDTRIFFTDFIPISELSLSTNSGYSFSKTVASSVYRVCLGFYNSNQSNTPNNTLCIQKNSTSNGISFGSSINYQYYRLFILSLNNNTSVNDSFGLQFESGSSPSTFVAPTEETCTNALTDDSEPDNTSDLTDFINDFEADNPLLDILLFPVELLESSVNTCQPLSLSYTPPSSYNINTTTVSIPCGTTVFWNNPSLTSHSGFNTFKVWWNLFVGGLALYFVSFKLYHVISNASDPFKDDISSIGGI